MHETLHPQLLEGETVSIPTGLSGSQELEGHLYLQEKESGLVLFADGLGTPSESLQHRMMSQQLLKSGLSVLDVNLLTLNEISEDLEHQQFRTNISLLSGRLLKIIRWVQEHPILQPMPLGIFSLNTGTAAAIQVENKLNQHSMDHSRTLLIKTIVSRGGRPDLVPRETRHIQCPILLIVGAEDYATLSLNQEALSELETIGRLEIVPKATHHFEEPRTLETSTAIATQWLQAHLSGTQQQQMSASHNPQPTPFDTNPFRLGRTLFKSIPGI